MSKEFVCHKCKCMADFKSLDLTKFIRPGYIRTGWVEYSFSQGLNEPQIVIYMCENCTKEWHEKLAVIKKVYEDSIALLYKDFLNFENVKMLFAFHINKKENP